MIEAAFYVTGAFAVVLGALHFSFPRRFGFVELLKGTEPRPPSFRLGPIHKELSRSDVLGIAYVMNHAASFVIVSIGVFDLLVAEWLGTSMGNAISAWAGLFWFLRAGSQLCLGFRRGDRLIIGGFAVLGAIQWTPLLCQ